MGALPRVCAGCWFCGWAGLRERLCLTGARVGAGLAGWQAGTVAWQDDDAAGGVGCCGCGCCGVWGAEYAPEAASCAEGVLCARV